MRKALASMVCTLVLFAFAPTAQAVCPSAPQVGVDVVFMECTETINGADVNSVTLAVPATRLAGDVLIAVVSTDGNTTFNAVTGWTLESNLKGSGNANTLGVFKRIATGTEPASYAFTWGGTAEQAYSFMMSFRNSSGVTAFTTTSNQSTGAPTAPLIAAPANSLILRIAGWDDDDTADNPATIIANHTNITLFGSSATATSVTGAAAYQLQGNTAGNTTTGVFPNGNEEWAAMTMTIAPIPGPSFLCAGVDGSVIGSQRVIVQACTETKVTTNVLPIALTIPAGTLENDMLLSVVNSDAQETVTPPGGWNVVNVGDHGTAAGPTLAIYSRRASAADQTNAGVGTYTFNTGTIEQKYGYMLRLTGASEVILSGASIGTTALPIAPTINTLALNTLVMRIMAADDPDIIPDPLWIMHSQRNITQDRSTATVGEAVSGAAVYVSQAGIGATGTATFSLTASEEWRAATIGIEPIEFRLSQLDGSASTCGTQLVTLRVTDKNNNPLTWFRGTVTLSTALVPGPGAGTGNWFNPGALTGTLNNGALNDGIATYTFAAGDNGVATFEFHTTTVSTLNFNIQFGVLTNVENAAGDTNLIVDNLCRYRIAYQDGVMGTCGAGEPVTVSIVDSSNQPATRFTGMITISNAPANRGNYSLTAGTLANFSNGTANDGAATYTFVQGESSISLLYADLIAGTINFDVTGSGYLVQAGFDPNLAVSACEARFVVVDGLNQSDICSVAQITIRITDSAGNIQNGFTGTINISNSPAIGDWTGGGVNIVGNGAANDGIASYVYAGGDAGTVTLNFTTTAVNSINFFASGTATNGATVINSTEGVLDNNLNVLACTIDIQRTDGIAETCSVGEVVTYTIRNRNGITATNFTGAITLTNDKNKGDYAATGQPGTFANGTLDDGVATYTYATNGILTVTFSHKVAEVVTLGATAAGFTINVASNRAVTFNGCEFRISYTDANPGTSDVCSRESVRISVFSTTGAAVTSYVGTVNLSTSTGRGTWTNNTGSGSVVDPFAGDGLATYNFVSADNGVTNLFFTSSFNEVVNINITDGTTSASNPAFDPNLTVALCTYRIAMTDGTMTACLSEVITFTVYNSLGAIATTYTGTVSISTNTLHGSWALQPGFFGVLTDTTPDDGLATYTFHANDNGTAQFSFTNPHVETVNVNLIDGAIIESGAFDPNLSVTGCIPGIVTSTCFPGASGGTGSLAVSASNPGRMVVMVIFQRDNKNVTSATFGGAAMTQIHEITGINTGVEMWGILNANIPAGPGPHAGAYNFSVAPATTASMCLVELSNTEQAFPTVNLGIPSLGSVNGTASIPNGAPNDMLTSITTSTNNAFILSAGVSDFTQGGNTWFNSVSPSPPMSQLFFGNNNQNPVSGTAGGSSGTKPVAGLITVTDTDNQDAFISSAHMVASFNPRFAGPPSAVDYEPVLLFDTLSGNISYRTIGRSMRTVSNNSGGACTSFSPSAAASSSSDTLTLPAGSTVVKAFVYWSGSGEAFEADANVNFGVTGSLLPITADDVFYIDNVGGAGNLDFFAAYKDVTSQVSGSASYTLANLTVQNDPPWSQTDACAGGWALVVFYSNPQERFRVANLFHGFQPFQNASFTLVPRNFRMATTDNPGNLPGNFFMPNGEITHITLEGDETLATGDESLGIQTAPGLETFATLSNSFNPMSADFNSTVTTPIWANTFGTGFFEFNKTAGLNGDGYAIHQPGPDATLAGRTGVEIGASWGFDIDTHYIGGNNSSGVLWNFAQPNNEAEAITTRYSSGQDLVMLISEVISVTNFPVADMEIFKSQAGAFKVNGTGQYLFTVTNNGSGGNTPVAATGQILVADVLPAGLTLASVSGTGWNCSLTTGNAFTCRYNIATTCSAPNCPTPGLLAPGASLPVITANINVGDTSFFPLISNNVKNVARMQHNGGSCGVLTAGVIPLESSCARSPQFDNKNDLEGGAININNLNDKAAKNNNVHSIITAVQGIRTDLGITKTLNGILEVSQTGSYTLTVTNYGPDATTGGAGGTIVVTDAQPAGITFNNASGAGWACSVGPLNCTYAGVLGVGNSATITLNVTVTGSVGQNVTNTAAVVPGTFNFDANSGNNSGTNITLIVSPPVASQERFLMSVSLPGNSTQIGGLAAFENHDYIVFNPQTDVGSMFYDNSALGYDVKDADAVHLFKNGHIAVSSDLANSTIGSNSLVFQPEDIVVWDPILLTASMLFDGSAIFTGPITGNHNIDAVYVKENGRIVFSTAGPATITWNAGMNSLSFNQGDIIEYNPANGSATMLIDASDANIFGGEVQVNGLYIRVDATDSDANRPVYVLAVSGANSTIGVCGGCGPPGGTAFTRDDIVEIDLSGANPVTKSLFVGDQPLGVFTPVDNNREIDAIHVVEDGYMGHFAISQSQLGNTCQAGQITIRKHRGLSHNTQLNYIGTIRITTDIGQGNWSVAAGNGTLNNGVANDGAATYTFVPADNGSVTLFLTQPTVSTINVNVTNGITRESNSEDPNFIYNSVITNVTYRDEWSAVSFANNNGTTFWNGNWVENDVEGVGPVAGNILVNAGKLEMTSTIANPTPNIARKADLSLFTVTQNLFLNFQYGYQFLNAGSDILIVEARPTGGAWTTVRTFSGIGGTNLTMQSESLNLTTLLGSPAWTANTEIRFRITGGYTGTSRMFFDNIELATGTTDCGIGAIQHYEIRIDGQTGTSALQVPGISCVGSIVTITGHDLNNFPSASNESITLSTSTSKGDWTLLSGSGAFNNGALGDGIATYNFPPGELAATFMFNYTNPVTNPEVVNINLSTTYSVSTAEDPSLSVAQAGLLFYNKTANTPVNATPIPTQIAGKNSNVNPDLRLITIEAVRTSDNNPLACAPLFNVGNTLSIGFAAECLDPGVCSPSLTNQLTINGTAMTPAPSNGGAGTTASYVPINILMVDQGAGRVGGNLVFNYADAGQIEMHSEFNIPLNNNPAGTLSGNRIRGSSLPFIVRPFGFDIDFTDDRANNGIGPAAVSYAADATDPQAFAKAGEAFLTSVTAVTWQQADDANNDGIPDAGASLGNNSTTPNYGNESTKNNYNVLVSLDNVVAPAISNPASALGDSVFATFVNGVQTKSMVFNEVGIINLSAQLIQPGSQLAPIPLTFMGTSNVFGNVKNVGRFTPYQYVVSGGTIVPRPLAAAQSMCIANSTFTYMGEAFGLSAMVEAQNLNGVKTANYVDGFVKLPALNNTSYFSAYVPVVAAPDTNLSSRLALGASAPLVTWPVGGESMVNRGRGALTGNLRFARQASGVQDGPFSALNIGINASDSDAIGMVLDVNLDDVMPNDTKLINVSAFRYGRLLVENGFGPETEPMNIAMRIQYFNGTQFVDNVDDSCTTLLYDGATVDPAQRSLFYVPGSFQENLQALETAVEAASNVAVSVFQGRTGLRSGVDFNTDGQNDDRPFVTSAPGETNEGRVLIEFNLSNPNLPFSLDFLRYDWRGGVGEEDIYDEVPEGASYNDNPRATVEFGSYRGHDRVINWQEIYIGPTGP